MFSRGLIGADLPPPPIEIRFTASGNKETRGTDRVLCVAADDAEIRGQSSRGTVTPGPCFSITPTSS